MLEDPRPQGGGKVGTQNKVYAFKMTPQTDHSTVDSTKSHDPKASPHANPRPVKSNTPADYISKTRSLRTAYRSRLHRATFCDESLKTQRTSLHACGAVDAEDLSVDPFTVLAGEEADDTGDVDGETDAGEGGPGGGVLEGLC